MRKSLLFSVMGMFLASSPTFSYEMFAGERESTSLSIEGILPFSSSVFQNTVSGTVTGSSGPIEGVTVSVVGGTASTQTDANGRYTIQAPLGSTLRFSSVGFATKEVSVSSNSLSVTLDSGDQSLDEVVVVGYGTQRRGNLTGAVSSINVKENLEGRPIADVGRGIQGTTPGLTITIPSGEIGSDPTIKIRGAIASVQGNGNPLILLDNVE